MKPDYLHTQADRYLGGAMDASERQRFSARIETDPMLRKIVEADREIMETLQRDAMATSRISAEPPARLLSSLARSHAEPSSTSTPLGGLLPLVAIGIVLLSVVVYLVGPMFDRAPEQRIVYRTDTIYLPAPAARLSDRSALDSATTPPSVATTASARPIIALSRRPAPATLATSRRAKPAPAPSSEPIDTADAIVRQIERESRDARIPVRRNDSVRITVDLDR